MSDPRPMSIVNITSNNYNYIDVISDALVEKTLLKKKGRVASYKDLEFLFMGEIVNRSGHCVVIETVTGKPIIGLHTDNFVEVKE